VKYSPHRCKFVESFKIKMQIKLKLIFGVYKPSYLISSIPDNVTRFLPKVHRNDSFYTFKKLILSNIFSNSATALVSIRLQMQFVQNPVFVG
jgi:hypothetical protein